MSREQVLKDSGFANLYRSIVGWSHIERKNFETSRRSDLFCLMSSLGLDSVFSRFCDDDGTRTYRNLSAYPGILRDRGLTEMLLLGGLDKELSQMILSRAQWLSEHYVCARFHNLRTLNRVQSASRVKISRFCWMITRTWSCMKVNVMECSRSTKCV